MSDSQISRLTFTNIPSSSPLMDKFQTQVRDYGGVVYKINRKKKIVEVGVARRHVEGLTNLAQRCNLQPI